MEMKPVKSSQVESVGFENGTLAVKFKSGGLYHYDGVKPETYDAMLKSESIGKFLGQHVKANHSFKKVA